MTANDLMRIAISVGLLEFMRNDVEVIVESANPDLSLDEINDMMLSDRRLQIVRVRVPEIHLDSCFEHFIEEKPFKYEREHITKFQRPKRGKRK